MHHSEKQKIEFCDRTIRSSKVQRKGQMIPFRAKTSLLCARKGFRAIYPFSHLIFIPNPQAVYCYHYFPEEETDLERINNLARLRQ